MELPIRNRSDAGRALAEALGSYAGRDDLLVLALPRGGVPVALEVARRLDAPLDLMLVRKLGSPGNPELAMGAIASGGIRVLNQAVISAHGTSDAEVERVAREEQQELERRERAYRGDRPRPEIRGRCVILVDDGIATGTTVRAALRALHKQSPNETVVAVPVAPADTVEELKDLADTVVCPETPEPFMSIGQWYVDFEQTTDEEVRRLLARSWQED